jgi:hypothetical protein
MADRDSPDIAQKAVISNPSIGHFWTHLELRLDMQRQRYEMSILCPGHFHKTCTQRAKAEAIYSVFGAECGQDKMGSNSHFPRYIREKREAATFIILGAFLRYLYDE